MSSDIIKATDDAIGLIESGMAGHDEVLAAIEFVAKVKEISRHLNERVELAAIEWIKVNGDLNCGDTRYYVGVNKTTKCVDIKRTLEAVLTKTGGDIGALVTCLSSGAFKPAATKKLLGEEGETLFLTKTSDDLKTGKPGPERLLKTIVGDDE